MNTLELARKLVAQGFAVFPVAYGTKVPACAKGFLDATKDDQQLVSWFDGQKQNIGVYPGFSDCVVIDVDVYKPGEEHAMDDLIAELGELPKTYTVKTCRGGWHLYFRKPEGRNLHSFNNQMAKGVDVRGTGGYVLAEGSEVRDGPRHAGQPVLSYSVVRDLPMADLPESWIRRWEALAFPKPKTLVQFQTDVRIRPGTFVKDVHGVSAVIADGWKSRAKPDVRAVKFPMMKEMIAFFADVVPE